MLAGGLLLLCFAALSAWYSMPIYPDEIAFRLQLGRYIQDQGMVQGLYPLCTSNAKETPLLFVIPAWILSWLDLSFSPVEVRVLPFIVVMAAMFLVIWYAIRGITPQAAVVVTTAFIGVAGSGLVMARYEYVQVLNIVICLGVFYFLNSAAPRNYSRFGLCALLLISSLLSLYSHVQGLLFLPLTLYLAYHLLHLGLGKTWAALLMVVLLITMTETTISFNHSNCAGYPEIEQFWTRMTINQGELTSINFTDWLTGKFDKYFMSFIYKDSYAVNYLPGIKVEGGAQQNILAWLNQGIQIILMVNFLLFISVAIGATGILLKRHIAQRKLSATWASDELGDLQAIALLLFAAPVIFLFIYDSAQNFYRSFVINFLIAILLTLFLSRVPLRRAKIFTGLYFFLCGIVVVGSLIINVWWFTEKLRTGYEGPSISLGRDWSGINRDVNALVKDCGMDMSKGRIVLDDLTYDSLKSYHHLYAATYMGLSVGISNMTMNDAIDKVRPNYAIARCDTLRRTSIEIQHSRNQLCCVNFTSARATK